MTDQRQSIAAWLDLPAQAADVDPVRAQTAKVLLRALRTKDAAEAAQKLHNLVELDISRDPWSSSGPAMSFGFLPLLPKLRSLKADHQRVPGDAEAAPLWSHPWTLLSLRLFTGAVVPVTALVRHSCATLQAMDLGGCSLDAPVDLAALKHLKSLALPKTGLKEAGFVEGMPDLESLDLSENNLSRMPPLGHCQRLRFLKLNRNALADLGFAAALRSLRTLEVAENALTDLTPLAGLRDLQTLRFARNSVRTVKPLRDLDGLETVALGMNPIAEDEIDEFLRRRVRIE